MTDERQTTDIPTAVGAEPAKLYLVFRADLDLGPGKAAVMGAHMARLLHPVDQKRMALDSPVIAVKVEDEVALFVLLGEVASHRLPMCPVRDAGRTTIPAGTLVGASIGPLIKTPDCLARLPLL